MIAERRKLEAGFGEPSAVQPGADVIRGAEIAALDFRGGFVFARILLERANGERLKLVWMRRDPNRLNPSIDVVERGSRHALGSRLRLR